MAEDENSRRLEQLLTPLPESENGSGFSRSIENGIIWAIGLTIGLGRTFWVLAARVRDLPLLVLQPQPQIVPPFLFLALAALPGSIYLRALAKDWADGETTYYQVAQNFWELGSTAFTVSSILSITLPVIVAATAMAFLISSLVVVTDTPHRRAALRTALYAFGFAMFFLAIAGILPLFLRAALPSERLYPGLVMHLPLPLWAQRAGIPFTLLGFVWSGVILASTLPRLERYQNLLRRILYFVAGPLGVLVLVFSVSGAALTDGRKLIGAERKPIPLDHKALICQGAEADLASDGQFGWTFVMRNASDETAYLGSSQLKIWIYRYAAGSERGRLAKTVTGRIVQWSATGQDVLSLPSNQGAWIKIAATLPPELVKEVQTNSMRGVGATEEFAIKAIIFDGVAHGNFVCAAESYIPNDRAGFRIVPNPIGPERPR